MAEVDPQLLDKIRTTAQAARHAADSAQAYAEQIAVGRLYCYSWPLTAPGCCSRRTFDYLTNFFPHKSVSGNVEPQVPPLRFAPVGMTKGRLAPKPGNCLCPLEVAG